MGGCEGISEAEAAFFKIKSVERERMFYDSKVNAKVKTTITPKPTVAQLASEPSGTWLIRNAY